MIEQINGAGMQNAYQNIVQNAPANRLELSGTGVARDMYVTNGDETLNIGQNDMTDDEIAEVVDELNTQLSKQTTNLKFGYHTKLKQVMISIVDANTNEILREIPPKKILDMCAAMMESAGLLMDKRG